MKKKRKYTRRKKPWKMKLLKIIIISLCLLIFAHLVYVNTKIIFSSPKTSDVLIIIADDSQNSQKITTTNQIILDKSIKLFNDNYVKKILILGNTNNFGIDTNAIINTYLLEKQIWGGSIAYENTSEEKITKNISLFLKENEWNSILTISSFSEAGKYKYDFGSQINQNNISIQPVYTGMIDSIIGVFLNYYYFWKM